jgi:hypothetical protein
MASGCLKVTVIGHADEGAIEFIVIGFRMKGG